MTRNFPQNIFYVAAVSAALTALVMAPTAGAAGFPAAVPSIATPSLPALPALPAGSASQPDAAACTTADCAVNGLSTTTYNASAPLVDLMPQDAQVLIRPIRGPGNN